jgi:hypothetical protein
MTLLESLQMRLQLSVEEYGETAPVTLAIKQELSEIESELKSRQERPQSPGRSERTSELLSFHVGFRKAKD